jgi:Tfp pilus assembly protein PilF
MNNLVLRHRTVLLAALLASLTGCQAFDGMVAKITHRNQAAYPSAAANDEPTPPLTAKQKADVQMAVARSLENQGNTAQAITTYLDVVKKDPARADAYLRLAVLHDLKGDSQSARKFYLTALKRDPNNAELHCDFGYSCYLERNWGEAESHLRRALGINPDCARAHTNLGLLLARTGREQDALVEFHKAGCDDAAAHNNLGFVLTLEERWPEAKRQFRLALAADPNSKMAKDGLAALRWRNGESKPQAATPAKEEPTQTSAVPTSDESVTQSNRIIRPR